MYFFTTIRGIPYGKNKNRGNINAPRQWTQAIINKTQTLPRIRKACILRITFLLPRDKYPADLPYGPDLDNLTKRFLDALNETIFKDAPGGDSCVAELSER
jgi:Holliday junction resolvase RusA-like endonuclease